MILARFAAMPGFFAGIFSFASVLPTMLLAALYTAATTAHAGRPLAIDDATITNAKGCELETWMQKSGAETEYWSLPNCNVNGNLELTLGAVRVTGDDSGRTAVFMQAKTLLKPLQTNGWGAGLAVANQYDAEKNVDGVLSVNVPVSFSFDDDRILVHVNSGFMHKRDGGRDVATWGTGAELQLTERTGVTSEVYRQDVGKPFFQFGIRHQLIRNRMQIDASYGDRLRGNGSADRFFSIGIVLSADAIIP
jgi:hypothetical protein